MSQNVTVFPSSAKPTKTTVKNWQPSAKWLTVASVLTLAVLFVVSLSVGVADFSWAKMWQVVVSSVLGSGSANAEFNDLSLMLASRLPRTLAVVLTGASLAVAGTLIQVVLKNRFVEPSMVGATQASALGLLVVSIVLPASSPMLKMSVATVTALIGMVIFMRLIKPLPVTDYLLIPLVGIVFGGVIDAITVFIAYQTETMQMLSVWRFGDFSAVLAGRYEWLWLTGILTVTAYILADQLTIVGLGDNVATNLGVNKKLISGFGIGMVAMVSAVVVVTVGSIPFVGLVVPNVVSRLTGDQLRRCLPAVAMLGACAVLACDIIARTIRYPFEVPVATVFGVLGAGVFLWLLLRSPVR